MNMSFSYQRELFEDNTVGFSANTPANGRSGAFVDNMALPVHRWFRYSAGFSSEWVRWLIRESHTDCSSFTVLDPFAGVCTTMIACEAEKIKSLGFETHPFVYRIGNAKINGVHADLSSVRMIFKSFAEAVSGIPLIEPVKVPPLLLKCYTPEALSVLFAMRDLFLAEYDHRTSESELLWLVLTSILRACSGAGTAQWQYVLPNKSKSNVQSPLKAFELKATEVLRDIEYAQRNEWNGGGGIIMTDARNPEIDINHKFDAVVTSPPYPNNYDYADATRLEMTFWGEISGWKDLQQTVRHRLIRSCSQHTAAEKLVLDEILEEPVIDPVRDELEIACRKLEEVRKTKGGKKTYHTMAAAYFRDIGLVFQSLRSLCRTGSFICFVIGDSAPYGIYLNVDKWLGELSLAAGFRSYSFEKIRDRNIKWKNRKHRVPLKEGRLWIKG